MKRDEGGERDPIPCRKGILWRAESLCSKNVPFKNLHFWQLNVVCNFLEGLVGERRICISNPSVFVIYFQEHVWSVMHVSLYRISTHLLVFVLTFCYFVWTNLSFFPFPRLGSVIQQPFPFKRREPAENF